MHKELHVLSGGYLGLVGRLLAGREGQLRRIEVSGIVRNTAEIAASSTEVIDSNIVLGQEILLARVEVELIRPIIVSENDRGAV